MDFAERYNLNFGSPRINFYNEISHVLSLLEARTKIPVSNQKSKKTHTAKKSFPEYLITILDEKRKAFADGLKQQFKTEIGLGIRYMIEGLIKEKYLAIGDRQKKDLFRALIKYFSRDIGSYQGIFNPKQPEDSNIDIAIQRIKSIYNSL
jgi:hypothetical protein